MKKSFVWPALSTFVDCSSFSGITPPKFWYLNQTKRQNEVMGKSRCFLRCLFSWSDPTPVPVRMVSSSIRSQHDNYIHDIATVKRTTLLLYSANYFYIVLSQRCIYASRTTIYLTFVLPCLASCLRLLQLRSMEATDTIASSGLYQRSYRVLRSVSSPVAFIAATCN